MTIIQGPQHNIAGYTPSGNRCTCMCHVHANMVHIMPCCRPALPSTEPEPIDIPWGGEDPINTVYIVDSLEDI